MEGEGRGGGGGERRGEGEGEGRGGWRPQCNYVGGVWDILEVGKHVSTMRLTALVAVHPHTPGYQNPPPQSAATQHTKGHGCLGHLLSLSTMLLASSPIRAIATNSCPSHRYLRVLPNILRIQH